ncbi:MAG: penicillin-binding protein activator LpoB [Alphaproteobacteria bacterium]|nr:penicillin-binding protein activator LpoB [Alphaproteobacteria bacterium]
MKKYLMYLSVALLSISLAGCATKTQLIDTENDTTARAAGLEGRDFEDAANSMIADMLEMGTLSKPNGQPYILMISRIANDTMQRIDVDELSKSIRIALMKSGKVRVTAFQEDSMVMKAGSLRQSKEFNQANVRKKGSLAAPELSLSGKITQREFKIDGDKRIEYRFSLSITELSNGLTIWEGEKKIKKIVDEDAVTW